MSQSRISRHRRHDAVTGKAATVALETLRPSIEVISEQPHTSRADRRHVRALNGVAVHAACAAVETTEETP